MPRYATLMIEAKPYAIVGGTCFVAGLVIGALL